MTKNVYIGLGSLTRTWLLYLGETYNQLWVFYDMVQEWRGTAVVYLKVFSMSISLGIHRCLSFSQVPLGLVVF